MEIVRPASPVRRKKSSRVVPMKPSTGGRPAYDFADEGVREQIRTLAEIQCTDSEIAAVLDISVETITNRKRDDPSFCELLQKGRESGKESLRRAQWNSAKAGNPTLLIWLGKQTLGQRDTVATSNLNLDLATLSTDQLQRLARGEDPIAVLSGPSRES